MDAKSKPFSEEILKFKVFYGFYTCYLYFLFSLVLNAMQDKGDCRIKVIITFLFKCVKLNANCNLGCAPFRNHSTAASVGRFRATLFAILGAKSIAEGTDRAEKRSE